jgi:CHAT domain-containing protein
MGVPDGRAPLVADEAVAIAARIGAAELLVGAQATVAAFRRLAPGRSLIHLACHGMHRADNAMFSSLRFSDGWLTAADVASMDISGSTVVLSACETGRHGVLAGDELLGFARAFLGAGASTLVASLWVAHDEATTSLMAAWYDASDHGSPAGALRTAQLEVRRRWAHPYYWAAFTTVGAP